MPFSITGSGVIDLRGALLQADGLTFNTSGPATAQVHASQFGVDPGDVALDGTVTGSQFADTMEFFVNQSSFSAGSLSFANWSSNDSLIFRAIGSVNVAATAQKDTLIYGGGASHFNAGAGDDVLVADYSFTTNGYNVNTYGFWVDDNGYSGDLTTPGWVQGRVSFTGVNRFDYTGTQYGDNIRTGDNADTINGGDGNDNLYTGKGADVVDGGDGFDRWIADKSGDGAGQAITLNTRTNSYSGPGAVSNIEYVHLTLGDGNDRIITSVGGLNDTILGGAGNDLVSVAQGEDRFEGGVGIDTLIADFSGATTYQLGSGGEFAADPSGYSGQFFTAGRLEGAVVFTGVERFNITGTQFDDTIRTGDNADTLRGGGGNDYLSSGAGADVIDGGVGTGDKWIADKSADGAGKAISLNTRTNAYSGPGSVTNIESVHLSLGAGNDRVITFVGALNDTILGGGGDDTVSVAQGEDRFEGGTGNDLLIADFSGTTAFGLSSGGEFAPDASGYSGQFYTGGRLEGAVVFTGVDRFNIRGTKFADNIMTGGNADLLHGEAGNDTLNGGGGADTMNGGRGNDIYLVDNTRDVTNETVAGNAGGIDTIYSQVSRKLGINIENLVLEGTAVTGTSNTSANLITGNAADNRLDGGEGNDTLDGGVGADELRGGLGADSMTGGLGSDRYFVDNASDTINETTVDRATGGTDTVFSQINYTLGANLEILRLQGAGDLSGIGNQLNNRIAGNAGANLIEGLEGDDTLEGKDGADTIVGGAGNDTMSGGSQADVFRFATAGAGSDRITDFNKNADRFDLSGGSFSNVAVAANGDAILTHAGGTIRIDAAPSLSLTQWNALVLPSEGSSGHGFEFEVPGGTEPYAAWLPAQGQLPVGVTGWADLDFF